MALILDRHYTGSWMRIGTLAQAALAGGAPRALLEGIYDADIAPDGASFAVVRSDGNEQRLEYPVGTVLHRTNGWITSPRIARDGKRVAFADHPIPGDDQGTVAVVEAGSAAKKLSEPLNFLHGVAWSADGGEIVASYGTTDQGGVVTAFVSGRPPRELLRTIVTVRLHDIAASGAILLTADSVPVSIQGQLAAGDSRLGFGAQTGATVEGISDDGTTVVGTDGGLLEGGEYHSFFQRAGAGRVSLGVGGAAGIAPDGRRAFVYTLHRDRNRLRVIPTGPGDERAYDLGGVELEVSSADLVTCAADGRTIAFLGRRAGEEPRGYVFDLEAAKPPRAETAAGVRRIRISPDGRRLAAVGPDRVPAAFEIATGARSAIPGAVAGEVVVAWARGSDAVYLWNRELPARVERLDLATGRREPAFEWRPSGSTEGLYGLLTATTDARFYLMRFRGGVSTLAVAQGPGRRGAAYSARRATTRSMRVPRQAGAALAASATSTSTLAHPPSVSGSSAPTP
jgi:eukaryotic-like serine/threonine-protein kinase